MVCYYLNICYHGNKKCKKYYPSKQHYPSHKLITTKNPEVTCNILMVGN